ncbi:uncharacterized protein [Miscanthus floridulus]|uniref:uncharacterized protein n=1 Tax=Miscanthus floridulus TaxID=154761 RepID=UPI00345A95A5
MANLMPYSLYKKLSGSDEELIKTKRMVKGIGGKPILAKGLALMKLTIGSKTLATVFFVVEVQGSYNLILGLMKRDGDIASLYRKHEAKRKAAAAAAAATSNHSPNSIVPVVEQQTRERVVEETENNVVPPPPRPQPPSAQPVYDINRLPHDPGQNRQFNFCWMYNHEWLEYSIKKDAAFCFICYLFKKGSGSEAFTVDGWNNWNIGEPALLKHLGSKTHIAAQERYIGFINPKVAIDYNIQKWSDEDLRLYKKRLTFSLRCIKFLLHQGLAFRGHDKSKESSNRGNFIELLKFLAGNSEEVNKYVLDNAPGNCTLTSPDIQKQIIHCCALETRKKIIEELGDEPFAILADESSDISHKEQLALCLRYVDKLGRPCEHFIGVVHVDDTTSLSLKSAIEALLVSHGLSLTQIRGQGYDGASNMKGDIKGLKTLIMQDSPSAYYIHCFAHQLQLVLVAVAKGNTDCSSFFDQVSILLNIIGVSCKRHDMLRKARLENIKKALDCGEIESGTGLHQEMGLSRPGDTRWGSHYKTICSILTMYESIHDVLVDLGDDPTYKDDWTKIHFVMGAFETFEFVFFVHLMYIILGYTNELSECLQRREQDILNAISLVNVAKKRMQQLRSDGWNTFLEKVTSFCDKHGVDVPAMDGVYVPYGKSTRKARARKQTNDDHFRREVYIGVIDQISQELDNRFDEINMELLSCMVAFNPSKSFESFDAQKLRRLAEFYPKDFSKNNLRRLELQLDNYIDDIKQDDRFKGLENIVDLSVKLVQTKRHKVYDMVYELLKLVLLLPVATASVERVFSALVLVKTKTRNKMGDSLLDDCLVTFIERDIFFEVDEDDIIETFMSLRTRRINSSAR